MTIIIGVQADEGVVLAADGRLVFDEVDGVTRTQEGQKIMTGKNYAVAFSGSYYKHLGAFISYLNGQRSLADFVSFISPLNKEIALDSLFIDGIPLDVLSQRVIEIQSGSATNLSPIETLLGEHLTGGRRTQNDFDRALVAWCLQQTERYDPVGYAVRNRFFREFGFFNRFAYLRVKGMEEKLSHTEMILATNSPHIDLFHSDIFGNLYPIKSDGIAYVAIGRGSTLAGEYFKREEYADDPNVGPHKDMDRVPLPYAIKLAMGALKRAYTEVNSGGYPNLVVVEKDKITHHSSVLQSALRRAEASALDAIVGLYEQESQGRIKI